MTSLDPQDGDTVRITLTGPTPGESVFEGVVHRQPEDLTGFELKGRWITRGKDVHLWFAVDRVACSNATPGFGQTTTLIRKAQP
ncbi:hypothetical protein [Streptomyces sp. NPDC127072]|uniref:hypothetical protein n=1 Tax=Streptomyces sp. NPDC127072 TaxID=3347129 RepID=UPI0036561C6B